MLLPVEALQQFDNAIYSYMIVNFLERDRKMFEDAPFKLKQPYIEVVESALKAVRKDQRENNLFIKKHKIQVPSGDNGGTFTEFTFVHGSCQDKRKYLNARLQNRTEELLNEYLQK